MQGTVHQINTSKGGVPKLPVDSAVVGMAGIIGDEQADLVNHGAPDQALCLFSLEVIQALQKEGHPIEAGSAGENLTISGIDWDAIQPGRRLRIGVDLLIEITRPTLPCSKNAQWFRDGDFRRMSHHINPGSSRWYARVINTGRVAPGDPVSFDSEA